MLDKLLLHQPFQHMCLVTGNARSLNHVHH
jgi:hypothetical protein